VPFKVLSCSEFTSAFDTAVDKCTRHRAVSRRHDHIRGAAHLHCLLCVVVCVQRCRRRVSAAHSVANLLEAYCQAAHAVRAARPHDDVPVRVALAALTMMMRDTALHGTALHCTALHCTVPSTSILSVRSEWDFGKLMALKLANVFVLYIVKKVVQRRADQHCDSSLEICRCPLSSMGYQFFYLMVTDMTVSAISVSPSACIVAASVRDSLSRKCTSVAWKVAASVQHRCSRCCCCPR
jgi:hypothetical protein